MKNVFIIEIDIRLLIFHYILQFETFKIPFLIISVSHYILSSIYTRFGRDSIAVQLGKNRHFQKSRSREPRHISIKTKLKIAVGERKFHAKSGSFA